MHLKICCVFFLCAIQYEVIFGDEFITLIAPPTLYPRKPYSVFLKTSQIYEDTDVVVIMKKELSYSKLRSDQNTDSQTRIEFDNKPGFERGKGVVLRMIANQNGKCVDNAITLVQSPLRFHSFIQLDKPFYNPGDEMKIRAVFMDYDLKPIPINQIHLEIKDSLGNTLHASDNLDENDYLAYGIYERKVKIETDINLGQWTVSVNMSSSAYVTKKVSVEKLTLPLYQIFLETKDTVYLDDKNLYIKIYGKYAFGEYVKGKATISISSGRRKIKQTNVKIDTLQTISFNLRNDLRIAFLPMGEMNLNVSVSFLDASSQLLRNEWKIIKVKNKRDYSIQLTDQHCLSDSMPYDFLVTVRRPDGVIVGGGSEPVKASAIIKLKDNTELRWSSHGNIRRNRARFSIGHTFTKDVKIIELKVTYFKTEYKTNIEPGPCFGDSLKVVVTPNRIFDNNNDRKDLQLNVYSSKRLFNVLVVVFTRHGISYSYNSDCDGETACSFTLNDINEQYKNMKPGARIVVYNLQSYNKKVIYGFTNVKFDSLSSNAMNILLPSERANAKDPISITLEAQANSSVSLLAIDKKLTFVAKGNDITIDDVIDALTEKRKLVDKKSTTKEGVTYDEINNNFIIQLQLDKWRSCTAKELKLFDSCEGCTKARSNADSSLRNELNDDYDSGQEVDQTEEVEIEYESPDVRKNFPQTWIWDTMEITEDNSVALEHVVPDSMTTWIFTGFAASKEHGFAIAEPRELIVSQEFFIELNLPYSIKLGEVLKLEIIAFNFMKESINANITVYSKYKNNIQQFEFIEYPNLANSCQKLAKTNLYENYNIKVQPESGQKKYLYIQPLKAKTIEIYIEGVATGFQRNKKLVHLKDEILAKLHVENEGVAYHDIHTFEFKGTQLDESKTAMFTAENVREKSVELSLIIAGDFMAPLVDMESSPSGKEFSKKNIDEAVAQFGTAIWTYKYMKDISKPNSLKSYIQSLSQNLMRFKTSSGGFAPHQSKPSIETTSYIAQLYGSAIDIDSSLFTTIPFLPRTLNFIANSINIDPVEDGGESKTYNTSEASKKVEELSTVIIALQKNKQTIRMFSNFTEIEETINSYYGEISFFTDINNMAAAIAAYAASFNEDKNMTIYFIDTLKKHSVADGETTYWNEEKNMISEKSTQVRITAYVAMALIRLNKHIEAQPLIRWLLKNTGSKITTESSFSNVVALEAISMMAEKIGRKDTNMIVKVHDNKNWIKEHTLNNMNLQPALYETPKGILNISVSAKGSGYGLVQAYYEYFKVVDKISSYFKLEIKPDAAKQSVTVAITRRETPYESDNYVVVEINLNSGYIYDAEKTKPMLQNSLLWDVETRRANTIVDLFFEPLPVGETQKVEIFFKEVFEVKEKKKTSVKVYETLNKDESFASAFFVIKSGECV